MPRRSNYRQQEDDYEVFVEQWRAEQEEAERRYMAERAHRLAIVGARMSAIDALEMQTTHDESGEGAAAWRQAKRELYACGRNYVELSQIPKWGAQDTIADAADTKHRPVVDAGQPPVAPIRGSSWGGACAVPRSSGLGVHRAGGAGDGVRPIDVVQRFRFRPELNGKVSIHQGDITRLEVDAIVNAANSSLLGGGGIDGAIHDAAGPLLFEACRVFGGCPTGETRWTRGFFLPSKYVLHTVGPIGHGDALLGNCYRSILDIVLQSHNNGTTIAQDVVPTPHPSSVGGAAHSPADGSDNYNVGVATSTSQQTSSAAAATAHSSVVVSTVPTPIKTLGICCISTGIFSFPRVRATHIALRSVREWLERHHALVERIVFVVFGQVDLDVYKALMPSYFPVVEVADAAEVSHADAPFFAGCPPGAMFPYPPEADDAGMGLGRRNLVAPSTLAVEHRSDAAVAMESSVRSATAPTSSADGGDAGHLHDGTAVPTTLDAALKDELPD